MASATTQRPSLPRAWPTRLRQGSRAAVSEDGPVATPGQSISPPSESVGPNRPPASRWAQRPGTVSSPPRASNRCGRDDISVVPRGTRRRPSSRPKPSRSPGWERGSVQAWDGEGRTLVRRERHPSAPGTGPCFRPPSRNASVRTSHGPPQPNHEGRPTDSATPGRRPTALRRGRPRRRHKGVRSRRAQDGRRSFERRHGARARDHAMSRAPRPTLATRARQGAPGLFHVEHPRLARANRFP